MACETVAGLSAAIELFAHCSRTARSFSPITCTPALAFSAGCRVVGNSVTVALGRNARAIFPLAHRLVGAAHSATTATPVPFAAVRDIHATSVARFYAFV
jgi:hypothetical protein